MSSSLLRKPAAVVTTPPWAKDEPPTPDVGYSGQVDSLPYDRRNADNASYNTDKGDSSRWWSFTPSRAGGPSAAANNRPVTSQGTMKNRSMSWLTSPSILRDAAALARKDKQKVTDEKDGSNSHTPVQSPDTDRMALVHRTTSSPQRPLSQESFYDYREEIVNRIQEDECNAQSTRKKRFGNFILVNTYVPLFFRFINITLTSAALGIATRIRQIEMHNQMLGILGSSSMVVIIFAPLTLIHVLVAVYLEYFGRPVGLWKTSAKLTHTLSETLFICAWSAALSLCFDNFFTSSIPCAPSSSISWYSQLHRAQSSIPSIEGSIGDQLCDSQVALICLVAFGLLTYCINLIISLFRIFEKVKYRSDMSRIS